MTMTRTYDVGQVVWVEGSFQKDGSAADPTAITLKWRTPAGVGTTYSIADLDHVETGRYRKSFALAAPGVHVANWASSGDVAGADEQFYTVSPRGVDGLLLAFYGADPTALPRDQVRLLVGDTDASAFLLLDAEYDWLLSRSAANVTVAAVEAALAIAAKLSREVDRTLDDVSRSASQRAVAYRALAKDLRDQVTQARSDAVVGATPLAMACNLDTPPIFSLGMMDFPQAGSDPRAGC